LKIVTCLFYGRKGLSYILKGSRCFIRKPIHFKHQEEREEEEKQVEKAGGT
jgi:hypothetical protein